MLDFVSHTEHRHPLLHRDQTEMAFQKIEVAARQCGQQFVGRQAEYLCIHNDIPPGRSGPYSAGMNVALREDASTAMLPAIGKIASWCLFSTRQKRKDGTKSIRLDQ